MSMKQILWAEGWMDDADWPDQNHVPSSGRGFSSIRTPAKCTEIEDVILYPPNAGGPTQGEQPDIKKICFTYITAT